MNTNESPAPEALKACPTWYELCERVSVAASKRRVDQTFEQVADGIVRDLATRAASAAPSGSVANADFLRWLDNSFDTFRVVTKGGNHAIISREMVAQYDAIRPHVHGPAPTESVRETSAESSKRRAQSMVAVLVHDLGYSMEFRPLHGHAPMRHEFAWAWAVNVLVGEFEDTVRVEVRERAETAKPQTSAEEVERVARELYTIDWKSTLAPGLELPSWENESERERDIYLAMARYALTLRAPSCSERAAGLEEVWHLAGVFADVAEHNARTSADESDEEFFDREQSFKHAGGAAMARAIQREIKLLAKKPTAQLRALASSQRADHVADASKKVEAEQRAERPVSADMDRDRVWCTALTQTLDIPEMNKVLVRFNELRPDQSAPPATEKTTRETRETGESEPESVDVVRLLRKYHGSAFTSASADTKAVMAMDMTEALGACGIACSTDHPDAPGRIRPTPSPVPPPPDGGEPRCTCGHPKSAHDAIDNIPAGGCLYNIGGPETFCACDEYTPLSAPSATEKTTRETTESLCASCGHAVNAHAEKRWDKIVAGGLRLSVGCNLAYCACPNARSEFHDYVPPPPDGGAQKLETAITRTARELYGVWYELNASEDTPRENPLPWDELGTQLRHEWKCVALKARELFSPAPLLPPPAKPRGVPTVEEMANELHAAFKDTSFSKDILSDWRVVARLALRPSATPASGRDGAG